MEERRSHKRTLSAQDSVMEIFSLKENSDEIDIVGLVLNESWHGCCAVFKKPFPYKKSKELIANVGNLHQMKAEIKWLEDIDDNLIKIGFALWSQ